MALLDADPHDRTALIVIAAAAPRAGYIRDGFRAATQAYRVSDTSEQKYEAARLAALAAYSEERFAVAQFWLRRAAAHAPSEQQAAENARDFGRIRSQNPLSVQLQFGVTPSSNLNGGSSEAVNIIEGVPLVGSLSGDAQALSGYAATANVSLRYRLDRSENAATYVNSRLYRRQVWLSQDAQELSPDSENGDFASTYGELELMHVRRSGDGILTDGLSYGQSWFGGEQQFSFVRMRAQRQTPLENERFSLSYGGSYELRWAPDQDGVYSQTTKLDVSLGHQTEAGQHLSYGLFLQNVDATNSNADARSYRAQISYAPAQNVGPAQMHFSLGHEWLHFDDYAVGFIAVPGGRSDKRLYGSAEFMFTDYDYAGFAPVITIAASQSDSNVSRFERSEFSVGLSFRSTF